VLEQDFILRAIRQFAAALARIIAAKRGENWDEARSEIGDALGALTGMSAEQLVHLPLDSLLAMMRERGELDGERAAAVARLLKEHGEVLELSGNHTAKPYLVKAFCLLDELSEAAALPADHEETLRWLVEKLD